jgi:hypothetical protein
MDNPTSTNTINSELVQFNAGELGLGIKILTVNEKTPQDSLTTLGGLGTSGAKYVTDDVSTQIALGSFTINTTALIYHVFCNAAGIAVGIKLTGVDGSLNEVSETLTTNGISTVNTSLTYLCINDIEQVSGPFLTSVQTVNCRPSSGQDKRVILNGTYKVNPFIMVGRKNGVSRRARLICINQVQQTAACDYNLNVFNGTNAADTGTGIFNIPLRLRALPSPVTGTVNFGNCGSVELKLGELAVWFRSTVGPTVCNLTATWTFYNA